MLVWRRKRRSAIPYTKQPTLRFIRDAAAATRSRQIHRHALNLRHVVMQNGLLATIIPFYDHASPTRFGDDALIGLIFLPADFVADFQQS